MPGIEPLMADAARSPDQTLEHQLTLTRSGSTLTLLVRVAAQRDEGLIQGYVVTFDDITALLGAQRQAAWAEVARRIAHEVKNPLTPIRLSAERLGRKYQAQIVDDKETFHNLVATIVRQVDTIGHLISEFSAFARMPAAVMRNERLAEIVRDAVLLQQTAYPAISYDIEMPKEAPIELVCDAPKVSQALTNLLKNAAEVLTEQAGRSSRPMIKVRACRQTDAVVIEVEDDGPGFPPDRAKLFEPYVTTRSRGTGLGLAIVKKIMEEHSGKVELLTGSTGGGLVRLTFPTRPV
jgi:two-component system nitrogen regulation sensor histidine kinase NtrY